MHEDYDQLLSIQTKKITIQAANQSESYSPHEATPYPLLYTLFQSYKLSESDVFVDFGCGTGRVLFLAHHLFNSYVVGVEMNEQLYKKTNQNKRRYLQDQPNNVDKITITHSQAEKYKIQADENKFYFFNPFSIEVFQQVIKNIIHSYEENRRTIDLILYYPWDAYVNFLTVKTPFTLFKAIKIPGLYNRNNRERFLVYRLEK